MTPEEFEKEGQKLIESLMEQCRNASDILEPGQLGWSPKINLDPEMDLNELLAYLTGEKIHNKAMTTEMMTSFLFVLREECKVRPEVKANLLFIIEKIRSVSRTTSVLELIVHHILDALLNAELIQLDDNKILNSLQSAGTTSAVLETLSEMLKKKKKENSSGQGGGDVKFSW